jgi:serine phosphatase RsbU (regulator of sigma subunit)
VIYTDGFSEAMNPNLEEWEEKRLLSAVASCKGLPAEDSIARSCKPPTPLPPALRKTTT